MSDKNICTGDSRPVPPTVLSHELSYDIPSEANPDLRSIPRDES